MAHSPAHGRAITAAWMLLLTTVTWGLTFPLSKALAEVQLLLLPKADSWFLSSHALVIRFGSTALILLAWFVWKKRTLTRLEMKQGLGLGLFAAAGLLFQMDGLNYTKASTSAFMTQFYCIVIPLWVAFIQRRRPSLATWISCLLVLAGVSILAQFNWRDIRMGRGEWETLLGSVIFAGLILWLERPIFAPNNSVHATLIMAGVVAAVCLPVALISAPQFADHLRILNSGSALLLLIILSLACTLTSYLFMNHWQPFVSSTQAGLIYCAEPVFASLFALFLPGWISRWSLIDYPNEIITRNLLVGGGLITLANLLIIHQTARMGKTT